MSTHCHSFATLQIQFENMSDDFNGDKGCALMSNLCSYMIQMQQEYDR